MSEAQKWISIEWLLLRKYSIPVLAEAVDKFNVQTHDETGRRILATDGDENDTQSKSFVKAHLAKRRAMELDRPLNEEDQYWLDLKIETHGSPLDLFGWPNDQLPDFTKIQPHFQNPQAKKSWTQRTLKEFEDELKMVGSMEKAGVLHNVKRQRYSQVINAKRKADKFGKS